MLRAVPDATNDRTGYLVATFTKSKISVVANFRDKEDAKRFVRMMRMAGKGPDIGICVCESKVPLWSPLDAGIQPPAQNEAT